MRLTERLGAHHLMSKQDLIDWQWVFLANLTIETPLEILRRHADTVDPKKVSGFRRADPVIFTSLKPEMSNVDPVYGEWVICEKISDDSGVFSNVVVMDIPESACAPGRYLTFLTTFRSIIESSDQTLNKRKRLERWFDEETWGDVLVWWNGEEEFINRVIPRFLDHLVAQGIPKKVTDQLDILGIDNRLALTRLMHGKLGIDIRADLEGCSKKSEKILSTFCISEHLMSIVERKDEKTSEDDQRKISEQLQDPFIQTIY